MSGFGHSLRDDFTQKAVKQAAKKLTVAQRKTMRDWMSTFTDDKDAWVKKAFEVAFQADGEKPVKWQTVRSWFADSRSKSDR